MPRFRLILLGLLAALAVSAAASASASAARTEPCEKTTGAEIQLCIEGKEAGSPNTEEIPFTSKKKPGTVTRLTVTGGPIIECVKAENEGQFEAADSVSPEISDLIITFSECKVVNSIQTEENCEVGHRTEAGVFVAGTIIVDGGRGFGNADRLDGTLPNTGEVNFAPSEETEVEPGIKKALFTKIAIKNKGTKLCPLLVGNFNVTGGQKCSLPESEVEKETHLVECADAGSTLKFGENEATFKLVEEVTLTTREKFSVIKST
jgi:hypothetical protein